LFPLAVSDQQSPDRVATDESTGTREMPPNQQMRGVRGQSKRMRWKVVKQHLVAFAAVMDPTAVAVSTTSSPKRSCLNVLEQILSPHSANINNVEESVSSKNCSRTKSAPTPSAKQV